MKLQRVSAGKINAIVEAIAEARTKSEESCDSLLLAERAQLQTAVTLTAEQWSIVCYALGTYATNPDYGAELTEAIRAWLKRANESEAEHDRTAVSLMAFLTTKSSLTREEYMQLVRLCSTSWV